MEDKTTTSSGKRKRTEEEDEIRRAAKRERRMKQKAKSKGPPKQISEETSTAAQISQDEAPTTVPALEPAVAPEETALPGEGVPEVVASQDDSEEAQAKRALYKERRKARKQRKKAAEAEELASTAPQGSQDNPISTSTITTTKPLDARVSFPDETTPNTALNTSQLPTSTSETAKADVLVPATQYAENQTSAPYFKRESTAKRRKQRAKAEAEGSQQETGGKRKEKKQLGSWAVSEARGGRFIEADPVFTADEKHLILATDGGVNVYTTEDSLLAHSYNYEPISAYTLSASQSAVIWMATAKGHIVQWNFEEEKVYGGWTTGATIHEIYAVGSPNEANDTLYTIDRSRGWSVTAHRIGIDGDLGKTELAILLNTEAPIRSLKVVDQGRTIIAVSLSGILIGSRITQKDTPFQKQKYEWQDIKTKEAPTCLAVNVTANPGRKSTVDLAIGGVLGCIYLYKDVTNKNTRPQASTQLHWHREAVGALAWSLDGNYIISGGRETVLVLWQLETGAKQFLPHLESPVENVVVSPTGASYAIRLADNSVMVLSTSELTPTANIAGLQSFGLPSTVIPRPKVDTVTSQRQTESVAKDYVVSAINPAKPAELLVFVPASQSLSENAQFAATPYMQTYDVTNSRHIRRQAITRTNATNTNTGPAGERLKEPDVKLMQVTPNGKWMATVEEWTPPQPDVKDLTLNEDMGDELNRLFDTKLKIWAWNERSQVWAMNSRIDSPHTTGDRSMRNLDLVVDPTTSRFATIGADSLVKLWTPKIKTSSGKIIKGEIQGTKSAAVEPETWWSLDVVIPLENSFEEDPLRTLSPSRAKLAFSEDGTVLAAYEHFDDDQEEGVVHFLDPGRGRVTDSRTGLHTGLDGIHQIGFLDRYLICVGRANAFVWDVTNFELKAQLSLSSENKVAESVAEQLLLAEDGIPRDTKDNAAVPPPQLAIDRSTSTFAVVTAVESGSAGSDRKSKINPLLKYRSKLQVFSSAYGFTSVVKPITLPRLTLAMHPASGTHSATTSNDNAVDSKGYMLLDVAAQIRFMRPGSGKPRKALPTTTPLEATRDLEPPQAIEVEDMMTMVDGDGEAQETQQDIDRLLSRDEDDRPVVRMQELAKVFDYQSHAMPSMQDMFSSVLSLFAGRMSDKPSIAQGEVVIAQEAF